MWPSRLLLLCMRPARETRARRGWATVSGLLVLYFLYTVRLFRKKDMWVKIFRPARARFAQLAPVKFLGRVRYVTHRETLSAPSPRRRHATRRASSWQGGCRARRARATGARLGAHPASIARNSRPIVAASVPVANPSERGAARVPRTRTLPAGRPPSLGQRSLQEGRPRSRVRGHDRVTSRPGRGRAGPSRRAFSPPRFPRVMRARLVPIATRGRRSRAGDSQPPAQRPRN